MKLLENYSIMSSRWLASLCRFGKVYPKKIRNPILLSIMLVGPLGGTKGVE